MNSLLNPDNPVMQFITKIVNTVYLNILWFICSLPVFTIGASTTALYYVTLKMVKNEEGNITKAFFHSFRENFKQGTLIWMILLGLGIILGIDGYVLYHLRFENAFWTVCTAVFVVALVAYAIVLMYIFTPAVIFGKGLCAFLCSYLLSNILLMCEEKAEAPASDETNEYTGRDLS